MEQFYDHPAVTREVYVEGIVNFGNTYRYNLTFIFLLSEADEGDLIAVKKHWSYEHRSKEFRKAIEKTLLTAKSRGDRPDRRNNIQRAKFMKKTFENDSNMNMPTVISQLIASYLFGESALKSRTTSVKQTIGIKRTRGNGNT